MAMERLRNAEWRASLAVLVWEWLMKPFWDLLVKFKILAMAATVLVAIGGTIYSAGASINRFGVAGWMVAIAVAIITIVIVVALMAGLVAWASERNSAARLKKMEMPRRAEVAGVAKANDPELPWKDVLAALRIAATLEERLLKTTQAVDAIAMQQETFIETQTESLGQISKAVTARRRLERAEEIFYDIDRIHKLMDARNPNVDWDNWKTNWDSFQALLHRYYDAFLSDDQTARNIFLVPLGDLSPARWNKLDRTKFPDEEKVHQFMSVEIWHERFRGYHDRLRLQCNRYLDFDLD